MPLWDGADFCIKPHNHRQRLTLTPLFGKVTNVEMRVGAFRQNLFHVWKYRFGSALVSGEEFKLDRMEEVQVSLEERPLFAPIDLHWSQIHTVIAEPESAWLVEEGEEAPPFTERCFSVSHRLALSRKDLYVPVTEEALVQFSEYFTVKVPLANATL